MDLPPDWAYPALLEAKKTLPPGQTQALSEPGMASGIPGALLLLAVMKNPQPGRPVADKAGSG
jgi:hypothetical protein